MRLTLRKYRCDDDYWAVRQFLREVFLLNGRREFSWPLYRWDYWRWHVNANIFRFSLEAAVFLWETGEGRLAAVLHPEGPGEAFLEVHPRSARPSWRWRCCRWRRRSSPRGRRTAANAWSSGRTRGICCGGICSHGAATSATDHRNTSAAARWTNLSPIFGRRGLHHSRRWRCGRVAGAQLGLVASISSRRAGRKIPGLGVVSQRPVCAALLS